MNRFQILRGEDALIKPQLYAGWINAELGTEEELRKMGVTGKIILNYIGVCEMNFEEEMSYMKRKLCWAFNISEEMYNFVESNDSLIVSEEVPMNRFDLLKQC